MASTSQRRDPGAGLPRRAGSTLDKPRLGLLLWRTLGPRVTDPERVLTRARVATIPPSMGTTVYGLTFASNRVLHSGLDGEYGHFIAAYAVERAGCGRAG